MNKMKTAATRYPLLFALGSTLITMFCMVWPAWVSSFSQTFIVLMIAAKTFDVIAVGIHIFDVKLILLGLVVCFTGGFMDEAVLRRLPLRIFLPKGLMYAAFCSSLHQSLALTPKTT